MKKLTSALTVTVMFLAVIAADSAWANSRVAAAPQGQTYTMPEAGIQFQLPAGWRAKRDAGDIYVWTRDESVQMVFFVPDEDTFDLTLRELDKELGKTIKRVKILDKGTSD